MRHPDQDHQLVELRSYRLVPGAVAPFVEHFEARFVDSQAELGMDVVGMFTVPGDDARFVWVRRFLDPARRAEALGRFYGGPVWAEFGPRANELMTDYSDVHLLRPHASLPALAIDEVGGDAIDPPGGAGREAAEPSGTTVVAATFALAAVGDLPPATAAAMTEAAVATRASGAGAVAELARLVTADVVNDFPVLPVHAGRPVAVWLLGDRSGGAAALAAARSVARGQGLDLRADTLVPTARSRLR
jgi:hypothetical protein